jgi:hypothetical protein
LKSDSSLLARRQRLILQINQNLDFLIGSISSKGPQSTAFNLTTKVDGKTRSRSIPKDLLPLVIEKNKKHQLLKQLLSSLNEVNWLLTREGHDLTRG